MLVFDYDGIVISVDDIVQQNILGAIGKSPRWTRAYKFPGEQATSVVENIVIQVGRTGALTPVAILKPTKLGGSVVPERHYIMKMKLFVWELELEIQ